MKTKRAESFLIVVTLMAGCAAKPVLQPSTTHIPSSTATSTNTPAPTTTATPIPTATEKRPLTLVFYGDSVMKVGEVGSNSVGFSFVEDLGPLLGPGYNIIIQNYGGKTAKWAYENLERTVISLNPDVVTLMWGFDDLQSCGGFFDRATNSLIEYKLVALINDHIKYLSALIEALLSRSIAVLVVTPIPANGDLPWDHLGPDNEEIWELNYRCNYNIGMERLAEAQRQLVTQYSTEQKPVFLVDAWQVYKDNPNAEKMYMDIMHPASHGAELIAEQWLQVFKDAGIK
jgi:lysophospholipase L1-like esterase